MSDKQTIKAGELTDEHIGAEVKFDLCGWKVKGFICDIRHLDAAKWIMSEDGFELSLDFKQKLTILTPAPPKQPEEPTAFGACVEVAGVKYVRCDDDELEWKSSDGDGWWRWSYICGKGPVTVVNADPFAEVRGD